MLKENITYGHGPSLDRSEATGATGALDPKVQGVLLHRGQPGMSAADRLPQRNHRCSLRANPVPFVTQR